MGQMAYPECSDERCPIVTLVPHVLRYGTKADAVHYLSEPVTQQTFANKRESTRARGGQVPSTSFISIHERRVANSVLT